MTTTAGTAGDGGFSAYVAQLEQLAAAALSRPADSRLASLVGPELDGRPSRMLGDLIPLDARRLSGAFFTRAHIRDGPFSRHLARDHSVSRVALDPACGAGDLLLAWAKRLPLGESVASTLDLWGKRIAGTDINPDFIRAARARLTLLAVHRTGGSPLRESGDALFPLVKQGDGLELLRRGQAPDWVLMNPPFGFIKAGPECQWGEGRMTAAATFVDAFLAGASSGTVLLAVLPDVLRTGPRYSRWRSNLETQAVVDHARPLGKFDESADIDVFLLKLRRADAKHRSALKWWPEANSDISGPGMPLRDRFDIAVGPVVPHRHDEKGTEYPYLHARLLPVGGAFAASPERRRFEGRVFKPPFVVVRRTSRPGQAGRGLGTVITGRENVAVENHLIICVPRDGQVGSCRALQRYLASPKVGEWLDTRVRCRHLTVTALSDLLCSGVT